MIGRWFRKRLSRNRAKFPDDYVHEYRGLRDAYIRAATVSYGGVGILTSHARETYCSVIFTKLVATAHSILRLSPDPGLEDADATFLDYTAIAALSRVMIDTFIALYHFGLEDCDEDEFQTRQLLLFWRDHRVRGKMGMYEAGSEGDRFHTDDLQARLEENPFWTSLPEKERKHLLRQNAILHSPFEVMERAGFDPHFNKRMYSYWSAHTHCDSVAFLRMVEGIRGRGNANIADLELTSVCLGYVSRLLNKASDEVDRVLFGAEERGKSMADFDPFSTVHKSPPWEGMLTMEQLKASIE